MKQNYSLTNNSTMDSIASSVLKHRFERERADACLMALRAGIKPDAWQSDLLRSSAKQMILLCSRQSGKSTITSIVGLHTALYQENSLVLLLSPSLRQSQELFKKLKDFYNAIQTPLLPQPVEESSLRIEFSNGSRVVSLPGTEQTVRGFSGVALLIIDEASIVEDALYQSVRPMIATSNGRVILLSTPRGKRGFFHDVWTNGGHDWHRTRITADQCPRISAEWLENERKTIPDFWYRQEFECQFVETADQLFNFEDIQAMLSDDVKPLFPEETKNYNATY
ncbi:MAG: terminase family protein [Acidobacteria bacterium]|nr:terminase family protein [Acidobacteriota bacterium]MCA1639352.1 terminase family protein [Acidobacteriota bacterium]